MNQEIQRFPFWIKAGFLIAIGLIIVIGAVIFQGQKRNMQHQAEKRLAAVSRLKVDQIEAWRRDRLRDGAASMNRPYLVEQLTRWLISPQEQHRKLLLDEFLALQQQEDYVNILFVDANGRMRLNLPGPIGDPNRHATELAIAFKHRKPVLTDLHANHLYPHPHLSVIAPIFAAEDPSQPLGALILMIDPSRFLYPLIQSWPVPSVSAETLLVRREGGDVLFLNTLRHQTDTALKLRIPLSRFDLPASMAIEGRQGVAVGNDYRGVQVVSVLLPVAESPWFMVTKIDADEIFAPWRSRAMLILILLAIAIGFSGTLALFAWQHELKKHYLALYRSEAALRAATERHGVTLKSIGDAVIVTDVQGHVELLNPVAEALTGWRDAEARSRPLDEVFRIINEDTRETVESPVSRVMRDGTVVGLANHTLLIDKHGNERPIADSGAPIPEPEGDIGGVVLVFRDQSEEHAYQKKIHESEQQKRLALEAAELGIWRYDPSTDQIRLDERAKRCAGFSKDAVTLSEVIERVHPDDAERLKHEIASVLAPRTEGERFETEYRVIQPDGNVCWLSVHVSMKNSGDSEPRTRILGFGTVQDVTGRKQAEESLRRLNATLEEKVAERTALAEERSRQLQSLAVELIEAEERERQRVSELLHEDLQQVLAAARFQLQAVYPHLPAEPGLVNVDRLLEESIGKSRRLSQELSPPLLHQACLVEALQWLANQMQEQFGLQVHLETESPQPFDSPPLKVFMFRAVQELLFNVFKHAGIKTARVALTATGDHLVITVSDNGNGFDPDVLQAAGATPRIGLLSLRERAGHIGGRLAIESAPGNGSRLTLTLPRTLDAGTDTRIPVFSSDQAPAPAAAPAGTSGADTIRVLFVDDHKVMRQGLISILSGQPGIVVAGEASNGQEAIEKARQLRPDVIVMDISMPEVDGLEATRRIKAEIPGIRIIGLTMHDDTFLAKNIREVGAEALVSKTASSAELLKAIYGVEDIAAGR